MLFYSHQAETPEKTQRFSTDEPYRHLLPFERALAQTLGEWSNLNCLTSGRERILDSIGSVLFRLLAFLGFKSM